LTSKEARRVGRWRGKVREGEEEEGAETPPSHGSRWGRTMSFLGERIERKISLGNIGILLFFIFYFFKYALLVLLILIHT
jgi:hypothetical protein